MHARAMLLALVGIALAMPSVSRAADCGVPGKAKIFDRPATSASARIIYRSGRAACLDKGGPGSVDDLSGSFDIAYIDDFGSPGGGFVGSSRGAFVMPPPWHLHKELRVKYLNRDAPVGGGVKVAGFRQARSVKISARSLGDGPSLAVRSAPPGPSGVLVIASISNAADGTTTRLCTRWAVELGSVLSYQVVDGGTGVKLFLKRGVPSPCDVAPIPTTTTTSTSSTTFTSSTSTSSTTTTSTSSTTSTSTSTTIPPTLAVLDFITGATGGICGEARSGGSAGAILKSLLCGGLNIGGGDSTVPEGPTPSGALTQFNADCAGVSCTITGRTAAETGSSTNCSATGCSFGPFLSIANGGLSTCVNNTFLMDGSGSLALSTGSFTGSVPLQSEVTVTGNDANPCPSCVASQCDGTATNAGAACTAVNPSGDTYDCIPSGVVLVPFGVDLSPIGTAVASKTGPTFCPGQSPSAPGKNGCFGFDDCDYIEERGVDAAGLTIGVGPKAATLASVFCIPATGNNLIDGAADLPGPGATSLPGTLELTP